MYLDKILTCFYLHKNFLLINNNDFVILLLHPLGKFLVVLGYLHSALLCKYMSSVRCSVYINKCISGAASVPPLQCKDGFC